MQGSGVGGGERTDVEFVLRAWLQVDEGQLQGVVYYGLAGHACFGGGKNVDSPHLAGRSPQIMRGSCGGEGKNTKETEACIYCLSHFVTCMFYFPTSK